MRPSLVGTHDEDILGKGRLPAGLIFKFRVSLCLLTASSRVKQGSHLAGQWCTFCTSTLFPAFQMVELEVK